MKNSYLITGIIVFVFFCNKLFSQVYWEKTNGPTGGTVSTMAFRSSEIFAGTSSGIFSSGNNGNTWVFKSNGLTGSVTAILNSTNFIFVGTDEGIFRSADNGNTWLPVNNGLTVIKITSLAKKSDGVLFAGAYDFDEFKGGVFRSANNGESWTAINNGFSYPSISTLIVAPNGYIFAGLTTSGGIYRSVNNGDNWEKVYSDINVQSFAINSAGNIFASYFGGILRTTDNGNEWTKLTNGLTTTWIYTLLINSNNEIFAGGLASQSGEVLFRSVNNGDSWVAISTLQVNLVNHLNIQGDILFAGTDRGAFRSLNNGNSWTMVNNGITASNVTSLQINKDGYIFAGYSGTGVFRSTDKGNTWEEKNNGLDLSVQSLAVNDSGHIFAGTFDAGLFRSTNNGENWIQVYKPSYNRIYSLAINDSNYIYIEVSTVYGSRVLKSTNNGLNWTQKNNGLSDSDDVLAFAFNSSGHIFAGTSSNGVFRSTDFGETWVPVNNGYTAPFAGRIEISPNNNVFVAPYYSLSGIYKSTNNGDEWEGLPVVSGTTVQALESNLNGDLFAGTYNEGIYKSTNNGDTWSEINNGLTATSVPALAVDSDGYIFAGTIGGGVFRSINSTTSVQVRNDDLPSGFSLSQNYPNPFHTKTKIRYEIFQQGGAGARFVKLKVYDIVGREVVTLVNDYKPAGEFEVEFQSSVGSMQLKSGIYYYQLNAGNIIQTKKMILIK